MGTWSLDGIAGTTSDFTTSELYGTNVKVTFRLRYRSALIGSYTEPPRLDWHEKFTMKEITKGTWWQFEANMYTHNPCSNTLKIWPGRYVYAYKTANGTFGTLVKGSCVLQDSSGTAVNASALAANQSGAAAQAEAVRNYLKRNGGLLVITIHDIPSIQIPKNGEHKERLLEFNCGLVGGGTRYRGQQHLDVDGSSPQSTWTRSFAATHLGWTTTGLTQVDPPEMVSKVRPPTFIPGECW